MKEDVEKRWFDILLCFLSFQLFILLELWH